MLRINFAFRPSIYNLEILGSNLGVRRASPNGSIQLCMDPLLFRCL